MFSFVLLYTRFSNVSQRFINVSSIQFYPSETQWLGGIYSIFDRQRANEFIPKNDPSNFAAFEITSAFLRAAPPLCSFCVFSNVILLSASRALPISPSRSLSTLIHRDALFRSFNYALRRYAEGETNSKSGCLVHRGVSSRYSCTRRKACGFTPRTWFRWCVDNDRTKELRADSVVTLVRTQLFV